MISLLMFLLLTLTDDHEVEIGEAIEAKVEHSYTCSTHTATYYERVPGEPWRVTDVVRTPTGRDCSPGEPFAPDEEGM